MPLTVKEMFDQGRFPVVAESKDYSGHGVDGKALSQGKLEVLFFKIKQEYGVEAGKNFVKMVNGLWPDYGATRFLNALYALEKNDWQYSKNIHTQQDNIADLTTAVSDKLTKGDKVGAEIDLWTSIINSKNDDYMKAGTEAYDIAGKFILKYQSFLDVSEQERLRKRHSREH